MSWMSLRLRSDNQTTELLHKLLEERGVEYTYRIIGGKTYTSWGEPMVNGAQFIDGGDWTELTVENVSPEQAIAATLGSKALTTEQVLKALYDCSTHASYDGCTYHVSGIILQALADQLNNELKQEKCHMEKLKRFDGSDPSYRCDVCSCENYEFELPRYCPNCGREVER